MGKFLTIYFNDKDWEKIKFMSLKDGYATPKDYIKSRTLKQQMAIFQELQEIKNILKVKLPVYKE